MNTRRLSPSEAMFLRDAQGMHRRNPDSFWVPPDEELLALNCGDFVKVCNGEERFWVEVVCVNRPMGWRGKASNIKFIGVIANKLLNHNAGQCGDLLTFRGKHIYDISRTEAPDKEFCQTIEHMAHHGNLLQSMSIVLVEAQHQQCPGSAVPSDDAILALGRGDYVKLGTSNERFWVLIRRVVPASNPQDIRFTGRHESDRVNSAERRGDLIEFQGKHVYEISPD